MLAVPDYFVEFAESAVCLVQSVVYFLFDLGIRCDGTSQVSVLVSCFQLSLTEDINGGLYEQRGSFNDDGDKKNTLTYNMNRQLKYMGRRMR